MIRILLIICFCKFSCAQSLPEIGEELIVNEPSGQFYNHISFPRLNILVKRGEIPSYKSVYGNIVVIDKVMTKNVDRIYVILKKKDGSRFFGIKRKIKANYTRALNSGELSLNK